jgi:hypothetical protein
MVLGDLSIDYSKAALPDKEKIEILLSGLLPAGSFMVLIRNYQAGDFRSNSIDKNQSFTLMISLRRAGREAALQKKSQLEEMGFTVARDGSISLN